MGLGRRGWLVSCALLCSHGALPQRLVAQAQLEPGITPSALSGIDRIHWPQAPAPAVAVAASAGYGFTESQGEVEGAHHRAQGTLGVGASLTDFFGVALRFDGRHDVHPDDGMGVDSGTVGDPRLLLRGGGALSDRVQLGGEAVLWLPGEDAPSLRLAASSVDLRATVAYAAPESAWKVAGSAGYRVDQSARSAPDADQLRAGDRLALEVSDFDALLVSAGVVHRAGALEWLGEVDWDVLLGKGAPGALESPLRIALGARYHLGALQLGVLAAVSPSGRPSQAAGEPLVPIPPRFGLEAALGYRFGATRTPAPEAEPLAQDSAPEPSPAATLAPTRAAAEADVRGRLLDADGAPVAGARVELAASGHTQQVETDAQGAYAFDAVPLGSAALRAERDGYEPLAWTIEVGAGAAPQPDQTLARAPSGQLRGLAQSFGGRGIAAKIRVRALEGGAEQELQAGEDGRFQLDVAPGRYEVMVTAPGYDAQSRSVDVEADQVLILNLDLRKAGQ